jgi:hypothetical protein
MNQRYVSIAAASLAALVVGIGPASAQISRGLDTGGNGNVNANTNINANQNTNASQNPSGSSATDKSSTDSISGSVSGTDSASGAASGGVNTNDNTNVNQSPSASPSMGDEQNKADDRDRMKQQEQGDKKNGLDRADDAAGSHGVQGRDKARIHENRQ